MTHRLMMRTLTAAAALAWAAPAVHAQTDAYPTRPISIVVPFGAGSGSDIVSRFYARSLKETLGASAVVELKPGAAGMLAGALAARAAPDGYTVLMGSGTVNAANYPLFSDTIKYAPKDFDVVATVYVSPPVLFAGKTAPGAGVAEVIAQARSTQRRLSCGSGNAVTQVACELLRRKTGADIVNVPYKGNAQSMTDLASGQIDLAFSDLAAAGPYLQREGVRGLAVPATTRLPALAQVRTFAEQGIADFEFLSWNTIFVPAGTPPAVIGKLNDAARHMLGTEEWEKQRLATSALKVSGDLKESQAFVASELVRWDRYVKETGVKGGQ